MRYFILIGLATKFQFNQDLSSIDVISKNLENQIWLAFFFFKLWPSQILPLIEAQKSYSCVEAIRHMHISWPRRVACIR